MPDGNWNEQGLQELKAKLMMGAEFTAVGRTVLPDLSDGWSYRIRAEANLVDARPPTAIDLCEVTTYRLAAIERAVKRANEAATSAYARDWAADITFLLSRIAELEGR